MNPNAEPPLDATPTPQRGTEAVTGPVTPETGSTAEESRKEEEQAAGRFDLEMLRDESRRAIERVGQMVMKPTIGAAVAGAIALGAAAAVGVAEAAVAVGAAYLTYRLLRKRGASKAA